MSYQARLALAFVCFSIVAPCGANAAPSRRSQSPVKPTFERASAARSLPGAPVGTPRRPEAQRAPAPDLWNPLKRKRMAMPLPPTPPMAPGGDYAF